MKKVLIIIIILLFGILCYLLFSYKNKLTFVVPAFDDNAVPISKKIENEYYSELKVSEGFTIGVNSTVLVNSRKEALINLCSISDNTVYIKMRLLNSNGEIVAESGLIKPGEYIEKIELKKIFNEKDKFTLKIMAYDPKTYYSMSAVKLSVSLKVIENE